MDTHQLLLLHILDERKDLSRFGMINEFNTILAHMDLLKQRKTHAEQHSVPYDIYTIPEFDVQNII